MYIKVPVISIASGSLIDLGLVAISLIAIIAGVMFILIYNALITLRNNVNKAWANIDVLLQKRYDLISKLVDTVKGYMSYERTVLVRVTAMRTAWINVQDAKSKEDKMTASNQITNSLKTLFADVEGYPDLKADQTFVTLQKELIEVEDEIADRREFYNDTVNEFNTRMTIVPYSLFSGLLGYSLLPFFNAPDEAKVPVNVNIS
jgi:LemA protein